MAARIEEHPVLIPTSRGAAGGVVCEPAGESRAALLFLHGAGRSGRSGFNSKWAHLSRRLGECGVTVLRIDLATEGDSCTIGEEGYPMDNSEPAKIALDRGLVGDVAAWFRERLGDQGLMIAGSCYGARLALDVAASEAGAAASLLIAPYLWRADDENLDRWRERMLMVQRGQSTAEMDGAEPGPLGRIDPEALARFEAALGSGPSWILLGERDVDDALALLPGLGERGLDVEVAPGVALYPGNDPDIQELVGERVIAHVERLLGGATSSPLAAHRDRR